MHEEPAYWGEFEFLCSFDSLDFQDVSNIVNTIKRLNFFIDVESSFATGKTLNRLGKHNLKNLGDFLNYINQKDTTEVRFDISGELFDLSCDFELILDLEYYGLCLSISENYLWGYGSESEPADIGRLKEFTNLCRNICSIKVPKFAELDAANFAFEDISLKSPGRKKPIPKYDSEKIFSEKDIQSLYNFYVFEYEDRLYSSTAETWRK